MTDMNSPVYEYRATENTLRFRYSTDPNIAESGWKKGDVAFYASQEQQDGLVPIYEYCAGSGDTLRYMYSTDTNGGEGWEKGDAAFYAYDGKSQAGTTPIYSFYDTFSNGLWKFRYSTKQNVDDGWKSTGIAFYAAPLARKLYKCSVETNPFQNFEFGYIDEDNSFQRLSTHVKYTIDNQQLVAWQNATNGMGPGTLLISQNTTDEPLSTHGKELQPGHLYLLFWDNESLAVRFTVTEAGPYPYGWNLKSISSKDVTFTYEVNGESNEPRKLPDGHNEMGGDGSSSTVYNPGDTFLFKVSCADASGGSPQVLSLNLWVYLRKDLG